MAHLLNYYLKTLNSNTHPLSVKQIINNEQLIQKHVTIRIAMSSQKP